MILHQLCLVNKTIKGNPVTLLSNVGVRSSSWAGDPLRAVCEYPPESRKVDHKKAIRGLV